MAERLQASTQRCATAYAIRTLDHLQHAYREHGGMDPTFGEMLRSVRQAQGLSLTKLAARVHYSPALIGHVETGVRKPTVEFAQAVDEALTAGGMLTNLARTGNGDDMYRRTLVRALGTLAGIGAVAPAAVSETIRRALTDAASANGDEDDWASITATYGRGFMTEPLPNLARRAVGDLMVLASHPAAGGEHGVRIAMVYGSSVASLGDPVTARRWYRTAVRMADNTGDVDLRAWSRARLAYRAVYEGGTAKEVLDTTAMPIARSRPTPALVEAHAARAHVYAGRSDRHLAEKALGSAQRGLDAVAEQDEVSIYSMPRWRLAIAESWVFTAIGDISRAERAQRDAAQLPEEAERWHAQVDMHRAWGMVQRDDIDAGAERAVSLMQAQPSRVIHGLGLRVHSAVPIAERNRPAVRELANALGAT